MTFKPLLSIGNIFSTPEMEDCPKREYVITLDPAETLPTMGKIILSRMFKGSAKLAWQVQYGQKVIDCASNLRLDENQLRKLEQIGDLPDSKNDELANAHAFAETIKRLGQL
jgi:hypothetical protein